jgi:hypothetical protein
MQLRLGFWKKSSNTGSKTSEETLNIFLHICIFLHCRCWESACRIPNQNIWILFAVKFYKLSVPQNNISQLCRLAFAYTWLSESTYMWEQLLKTVKHSKSKLRSRLTDKMNYKSPPASEWRFVISWKAISTSYCIDGKTFKTILCTNKLKRLL